MGARSVAELTESRAVDRQSAGRTGSTSRTVALCALLLLVFAVSLITYSHGKFNFDVYRVDLNVYRLGGRAWLDDHNLYGQLPLTRNGLSLGFTYPPISAVLMSPLAMVPARLAGVLITAITLGLVLSVLALFLRTAGIAEGGRCWRLAAWLLPVAALFEPLRTNLAYGQINVILMALVAVDCLLPATWWRIADRPVGWPRGALVGLAAALKLTPIVFVLYFAARRQWRAAATSVASFFLVTGVGVACAPHDSHEYWTTMVFDTGRIGPLMFAGNQSLNGFLYRARLTGNAEYDAWLAVAAIVGIIGVIAVFRAARAGRQLLALSLTACTTLLLSPVSWSHHWVWAAPVVLTGLLAAYRARNRAALALFGAGLVIFLASPQWWFPATQSRELHWAWWEQVIGSAYVWSALAALLAVALGYAPRLLPADPQ